MNYLNTPFFCNVVYLKLAISILFIGFSVVAFSQKDSVKVRIVNQVLLGNDISQELEYIPVDTVISKFYHYDSDGMDGVLSTGNRGGATGLLSLPSLGYGFNYGETSFDQQFSSVSKNILYNTNVPFARMSYVTGPKKYQNFNLLFTENINSTMNFTAKLKSYGSDGFYLNQSTNNKYFSLQNSFKSKKNKYGYFIKFSTRSGSINENGGIKGDSLYLNSLRDDKLNVQVWFDELSTNRYDERELEVNQFYRIGKTDSVHNKYSGLFLLLDIKGGLEDLWYENGRTDSLYFSEFNVDIPDSTTLVDKAHLYRIENGISAKYRSNSGKLNLRFGYDFAYYNADTYLSDSTFMAHSIKGGIKDFVFAGFMLNAAFQKGVSGYNSDGHEVLASISRNYFNNNLLINLGVSSVKSIPNYKQLSYAGSNIAWENSFGYIDENKLDLSLDADSLGLKFSASAGQVSNYTYYGRDVKPVQHNELFGSYQFRIEKKVVLKSYHFDFSVIYQAVDDQAPVNIANWIWSVSFYYQRYLFKGALELRYGIDYWQNSAYTADYYAPFTRSFVYQNDYKTGNYPYLDFYISARIKSAQGFVKFQNIGQLFLNQSYMMAPLYPMPDFGFSFGVRWDFFN